MSGITDPTEEYFKDGLWGWDGSRWQKIGIPFNYSAVFYEDLSGTASSTSYTKSTSTTPSGEIRVILSASLRDRTHATGGVGFSIVPPSGSRVIVAWSSSLTTDQPLMFSGFLILPAGYYFIAVFSGVQNSDTMDGGVLGYKVKLA